MAPFFTFLCRFSCSLLRLLCGASGAAKFQAPRRLSAKSRVRPLAPKVPGPELLRFRATKTAIRASFLRSDPSMGHLRSGPSIGPARRRVAGTLARP